MPKYVPEKGDFVILSFGPQAGLAASFSGDAAALLAVVTFRGLEAGSDYHLAFERRIEADPRAGIISSYRT